MCACTYNAQVATSVKLRLHRGYAPEIVGKFNWGSLLLPPIQISRKLDSTLWAGLISSVLIWAHGGLQHILGTGDCAQND